MIVVLVCFMNTVIVIKAEVEPIADLDMLCLATIRLSVSSQLTIRRHTHTHTDEPTNNGLKPFLISQHTNGYHVYLLHLFIVMFGTFIMELEIGLKLLLSATCSRPTALRDRMRNSNEDELHDRDYDIAALANNLSHAFGYSMFEHGDAEEVSRIDSHQHIF